MIPPNAFIVRRCRKPRWIWSSWRGLCGYLKSAFLQAYPQKVINIHPSLLPAFPGLEAWKQALDYGVKFTGCTVHFIDQGVDTGPIIGQKVVPILSGDTPALLHERIQQAERVLYPAVIGALAQGRISVQGRQTFGPSPCPAEEKDWQIPQNQGKSTLGEVSGRQLPGTSAERNEEKTVFAPGLAQGQPARGHHREDGQGRIQHLGQQPVLHPLRG